jgi:hypothetical protein
MSIALFRFTTVSCVLDMKCFHDLSCAETNFSFVGSKSMSPLLALHLGGVSSKGEQVLIPLRYSSFCFDKKGENLYKLVLINLIFAKTSFYTNFIKLNTKTSDLLINKVYVLSSTKRGRLLIQISPKNVIYILRSLLSFVNDKV